MNSETSVPTARLRGTPATDLVRWGPVVAGVVVGLGAFALFDALWFAIAASNGNGWVSGNLAWWVGGTAIAALLVAGFVAGLLSGVRGSGAGLANGVTTWGLLVVLALGVGVPGALGLSASLDLGVTAQQALWTTFWSLLIGLGSAGLGGLLGGVIRRPVVVAARGSDATAPGGSTDTVVATGTREAPPRTTRISDNRVVDEYPEVPEGHVRDVHATSAHRG